MKNQILIIGCGYWGSIIINTIKNLKKFKKIYVCDVDNYKTNLIKKRFGDFVNIIKLDKISKYEDIRYIYLATPPSKNLKLIKKLIPLNKKILLKIIN